MVIKTETCSFSEYRIYPGRGQKYVAKDGRTFLFLTKKNSTFSLRKVKNYNKGKSIINHMDYSLEKNEQKD
jgi:ribosomal protein L24E